MRLILWEEDEEFEPEADILFRENISNLFLPVALVWYAGMLVCLPISLFLRRLIPKYRRAFQAVRSSEAMRASFSAPDLPQFPP